MARKISIVLDGTEQQLLLLALREKWHWCMIHASTEVEKAYGMLYGDFKDAIENGEKI